MKKNRFREKGITLMELLVVTLLLSGVLVGITAIFVSGIQFLGGVRGGTADINPVISLESISKRIALANDAIVDSVSGDSQLRLRGDYALGIENFTPLNTPADFTDDTWVKYRFMGAELRARADVNAAAATNVGAGDTLVLSNLSSGASSFTLTNPTGTGASTVVNVKLVAIKTGSASATRELNTSVAVGAKAKG